MTNDDVARDGDEREAEVSVAVADVEAAEPAKVEAEVAPPVIVSPKPAKRKKTTKRRKPVRQLPAKPKTKPAPSPAPEPAPIEKTADMLRADLMGALKEQARVRGALERKRKAIEQLRKDAVEADAEIERAQKRVEKAAEEHSDLIAAAAVSGRKAPPGKVQAARTAVVVAEDARDSLKAARAKVERELPLWEKEEVDAYIAVEAVISAILSNHARAMLQEAKKAAAVLAPLKRVLASLWSEQQPTGWEIVPGWHEGRKPLASVKTEVSRFLQSVNETASAHPDPWVAARARLRADPNAALPELDALLSAGC